MDSFYCLYANYERNKQSTDLHSMDVEPTGDWSGDQEMKSHSYP